MIIHYNNGKPNGEKLIRDVDCIMVIGENSPVTAHLKNDKELTISLDNIECVLDDEICGNGDGKATPAKEPPILPIVKCKECKYAIIVTNEIGEKHLACNIQVPTLVEPDYYCGRGERK